MKKIKAFIISVLVLVFGVHYKVRASALALALLTTTTDYYLSGGKMTPAVLVVVWGGTIRSFFQKSVDVTGIGTKATADPEKDATIPQYVAAPKP
jgi:hypothetical protein